MDFARRVFAAWHRRSPRGVVITVLLATFIVLLAVWKPAADTYATFQRKPSWGYDIDAIRIREGVLAAPEFSDTLKWWSGTWVQKEVPFYRPLSSYAFWIQWKSFGEREWLYVFPTVAAHLLAGVLFVLVVFRLSERVGGALPVVAGLAAAIAFSGLLSPFRMLVVERMMHWKNQPDTLAAVCCFASLLCYLRSQEGKRGLIGCCAWYLVGCGFKEVAVPTPVICLAFEILAPVRAVWLNVLKRMTPLLLCGLVYLIARQLGLRQLGYAPHSNQSWAGRTLMHFLGPFDAAVVMGQWIGNAVAVWALAIALAWFWTERRRQANHPSRISRDWCIALFGVALVLGWSALGTLAWRQQGDGNSSASLLGPYAWLSGLLFAFQAANFDRAVASLAFLLPPLILFERHRGVIAVALIWTAAFLAPNALSPGPVHRYYVAQTGYLLMNALAVGVAANYRHKRSMAVKALTNGSVDSGG